MSDSNQTEAQIVAGLKQMEPDLVVFPEYISSVHHVQFKVVNTIPDPATIDI